MRGRAAIPVRVLCHPYCGGGQQLNEFALGSRRMGKFVELQGASWSSGDVGHPGAGAVHVVHRSRPRVASSRGRFPAERTRDARVNAADGFVKFGQKGKGMRDFGLAHVCDASRENVFPEPAQGIIFSLPRGAPARAHARISVVPRLEADALRVAATRCARGARAWAPASGTRDARARLRFRLWDLPSYNDSVTRPHTYVDRNWFRRHMYGSERRPLAASAGTAVSPARARGARTRDARASATTGFSVLLRHHCVQRLRNETTSHGWTRT
jgi:hypothetical protein